MFAVEKKFFESRENSWSNKSKWTPCWWAGENGLSYLISFPYMKEGVSRKETTIALLDSVEHNFD